MDCAVATHLGVRIDGHKRKDDRSVSDFHFVPDEGECTNGNILSDFGCGGDKSQGMDSRSRPVGLEEISNGFDKGELGICGFDHRDSVEGFIGRDNRLYRSGYPRFI